MVCFALYSFFSTFVRYITFVKLMSLFDNIFAHYSWQGVALLGVLVLLFLVQLYYYVIAYGRIARYRMMRRKRRCSQPPVSVVVVVRGEDERFLTEELPALLAQQYSLYEVVVVYVGGDMDYYAELQSVREQYSYMRLTKMGGDERIHISDKQAMNVGIKSAQYDNLVFTTTYAVPRSERWVEFMAMGFEYGTVVMAPMVPNFEKRGLKSYLMRMTEFHDARNYIGSAVGGHFYYAPRSNYGFTRRLYEATRGFNHLNKSIGENDLYMQEIASAKRTVVVMSPHSVVEEPRSSSYREWMEMMRYFSSTRRCYTSRDIRFKRWEVVSRVLLFLVAAVAMVIMPLEVKLMVALLMLLRYVIILIATRPVARKLGVKGVLLGYWIYDILGPIVELFIGMGRRVERIMTWR